MPTSDALMTGAKHDDGSPSPEIGMLISGTRGDSGLAALIDALLAGYRLYDFGALTNRERDVVAAIQQAGLNRDDVKLIKKLPITHYSAKDAFSLITYELETSGLEFFDQYLLEWPSPDSTSTAQAWDALVEAREKNLVKSIGVCNFAPANINFLMAHSSALPSVNQIELHPHFPHSDQLAWHSSLGIDTQTRMPFGRANHLLCCPVVKAIARQLNRSAAQVILRWHLQKGVVPLIRYAPRNLPYVAELGLHGFELGEDDMLRISRLALRSGQMYKAVLD